MGTRAGKSQGPICNEKVKRILEALSSGQSREEVAEEEGYSSWKSLDVYMRRRGFRKEDGIYVPDVPEEEGSLVPRGCWSKRGPCELLARGWEWP